MNRLSPESQALFDAERNAVDEDGPSPATRVRMRRGIAAAIAGVGAGAATATTAATVTATTTAAAGAAVTAVTAPTAALTTAGGTAAATATGATATSTLLGGASNASVTTAALATQGFLGLSATKLIVGVVAVSAATWGAYQLPSASEPAPAPMVTTSRSGASEAVTPIAPPSEVLPRSSASAQLDSADLAPSDDGARPDGARPDGAPSLAVPSQHPTSSSKPEDTVEAQAALLLRARAAVSDGRHAEAQRLLSEYQQKFGNGALAEEQQALSVMALCGRDPEGGQAAARDFTVRYPRSPLRAGVDRSCKARNSSGNERK